MIRWGAVDLWHEVLQIDHILIFVTVSRIVNGSKILQFQVLGCGVGFLSSIVK